MLAEPKAKILERLFTQQDYPLAIADPAADGMILWPDPERGLVFVVTDPQGLQRALDVAHDIGVRTVVPICGMRYVLDVPLIMRDGVSLICPRQMTVSEGHIDIEWWTAITWAEQLEVWKEELRAACCDRVLTDNA